MEINKKKRWSLFMCKLTIIDNLDLFIEGMGKEFINMCVEFISCNGANTNDMKRMSLSYK